MTSVIYCTIKYTTNILIHRLDFFLNTIFICLLYAWFFPLYSLHFPLLYAKCQKCTQQSARSACRLITHLFLISIVLSKWKTIHERVFRATVLMFNLNISSLRFQFVICLGFSLCTHSCINCKSDITFKLSMLFCSEKRCIYSFVDNINQKIFCLTVMSGSYF